MTPFNSLKIVPPLRQFSVTLWTDEAACGELKKNQSPPAVGTLIIKLTGLFFIAARPAE
jgi:hypothetical protein